MTREEYERLLQSDYWKGYSYSLIKERNFTCADCGRSFPNERNKLQVHHLVYRDINPWSYNPDELVVLCKECHQRRHGIIPEVEPVEEPKLPSTDSYTRSFSSDYNVSERDIRPKTRRYPDFSPKKKIDWRRVVVFICILAAIVHFSNPDSKKAQTNKLSSEPARTEVKNNQAKTQKTSPAAVKQRATAPQNTSAQKGDAITKESVEIPVRETIGDEVTNEMVSPSQSSPSESSEQEPELNILDDIIEVDEISEEPQANEPTELSTAEMLERANHANVVKQAKRAGVSTEGTTSEILERINHASVVKQAQRAGVSAEGTTSEILERINHASVVKQAQRAGVSTEGTTSEILERINHASVVKQAQRAGVSAEGTTSEILERLTKKSLEKYGE